MNRHRQQVAAGEWCDRTARLVADFSRGHSSLLNTKRISSGRIFQA